MEQRSNLLIKFKMDSREDTVKFLKSLWNETPQACPLCGGEV